MKCPVSAGGVLQCVAKRNRAENLFPYRTFIECEYILKRSAKISV